MPTRNPCQEIPRWVAAINDNPDSLHPDYTPAVHKLSGCGLAAAMAILPLLSSLKEPERLRAQRILEGVIKRRFGWKPAKGFPNYEAEQSYEAMLLLNGNYQATASEENRRQAIDKWNHWLSQNKDEHE